MSSDTSILTTEESAPPSHEVSLSHAESEGDKENAEPAAVAGVVHFAPEPEVIPYVDNFDQSFVEVVEDDNN